MTYIASFDIGKKNFAFCVEEIPQSTLNQTLFNGIPISKRYNPDGTCTDIVRKHIESIYSQGKIVLLENHDITVGSLDAKKNFDKKYLLNMNKILDCYKPYWDKCYLIIIEQQMEFSKKKLNMMAIKLAQHLYSYFVFQYADFKEIIIFPAYHKTQILGAPKTLRKKDKGRKKWAVKEALDILEIRNDIPSTNLILTRKKQDDLSDTICQLQAYKVLYCMRKI